VCGERIGGVVQAPHRHVVHGEQLAIAAPELRLRGVEAPLTLALRDIQPEGNGVRVATRHRQRAGILAIHDARAAVSEDSRLRRTVGIHAGVAVEVVLGDVEHRRGIQHEL